MTWWLFPSAILEKATCQTLASSRCLILRVEKPSGWIRRSDRCESAIERWRQIRLKPETGSFGETALSLWTSLPISLTTCRLVKFFRERAKRLR